MGEMTEHRPLVLIVDDNDDHRTVYAIFLEAAGFRVIEASGGISGIGQARTMRPDVILMDLSMPGVNGWQACQWLKTSTETSRIPIIGLTGHAVEDAERKAMDAGCDRFVTKGSDPQRVIQAIREVVAGGA
jgi:two-component system cell cycle response regulator DivK